MQADLKVVTRRDVSKTHQLDLHFPQGKEKDRGVVSQTESVHEPIGYGNVVIGGNTSIRIRNSQWILFEEQGKPVRSAL
jgi:hypothetical protein